MDSISSKSGPVAAFYERGDETVDSIKAPNSLTDRISVNISGNMCTGSLITKRMMT
jgi:hypothetical protein